jgi:hypothetical protein
VVRRSILLWEATDPLLQVNSPWVLTGGEVLQQRSLGVDENGLFISGPAVVEILNDNRPIGEGVVVPGRVSAHMETIRAENWWVPQAFEKIDEPYYEEMVIANQASKMTGSPPRVKWVCRPVGADNERIYNRKLGLGPAQLNELREKGAI